MKSDRFMELSDWEENRIACPATENGDFRAAQGEIDQVMTPEHLRQVYGMDVYGWMNELLGQWR